MAASRSDPRYVEAAQELYLELRGGGLTLSPLDADRIRSWRDRGLPLELALEALRLAHTSWAAAGRSAQARPFSLRSAERHVEELLQIAGRRLVGGAAPAREATLPEEADDDQAAARIRRVLQALEERLASAAGPAREACLAALALISPLRDSSDVDAIDGVLAAADEVGALCYLIRLPRPVQRPVVRAAMREAGRRGPATRRRYRAMLRACLSAAARSHGALMRPSDL